MTDALARVRAELAPGGVIRVGINTANPAAVTVEADGSLSGPCISLARGLSRALNLPLDFIRFASAGQIIAAEEASDAWDLAFLAVDSERAKRLHFSPPYLTVDMGFAVPEESTIATIDGVDSPGRRIATSIGAAYDLHLQRVLKFAERFPFVDPAASFAAFEGGGYDAVAGVRLALDRQFAGSAVTRILPGSFHVVHHAMVVPLGRHAAAEQIDRYMWQAAAISAMRHSE